MNRTATVVVAGLCAALPGRPLAAQHPVEYGLHAVATFATPDLVAGGATLRFGPVNARDWRLHSRQARQMETWPFAASCSGIFC